MISFVGIQALGLDATATEAESIGRNDATATNALAGNVLPSKEGTSRKKVNYHG